MLDGSTQIWALGRMKTSFLSNNESTAYRTALPYLSVRQPEKRYLSIWKTNTPARRQCHIWAFGSLITRFLSISKTTNLHYDTPHIWAIGSMKKRFLSLNKMTSPLHHRTDHIWASSSLKTQFSRNNEWSTCTKALLISECMTGWKHDSRASANQPPARRHSPYLSVWRPKNAIPEHLQTDLPARRSAHIQYFGSLKTRFLSICKPTPLQDETVHIWAFGTLNTRFLRIRK